MPDIYCDNSCIRDLSDVGFFINLELGIHMLTWPWLQSRSTRPKVLIVGGGPVGVFTALILARNGIKITLVEERDDVDTAPRAMAFQPCALAEMVEAEVYEDVYRDSVKDTVISWWKSGPGYKKQHLATISTNEGD
jgi:2-polyprenyl-6-methoxyphenol hydroxylase-like FAD-dependent oxidoreductase